tara:strand:- start:2148 stop:2519 length:372 start_codon:yes stop_codon:yes gene_type:complete
MSELESAFGRLVHRYERAKKYSKSEQSRRQIDEDLQIMMQSYTQYERMLQVLLEYAISGSFDDLNYEHMSVDLIILTGQISGWKTFGFNDIDALVWSIKYGCPFQENAMVLREIDLTKKTQKT